MLNLKPKIRIVEVEDLEGKQKKCLEIRTDTFCGTFPLKEETETDNRTILFAFVKFWKHVADDQIDEIRLKKIDKETTEQKIQKYTTALTKPQRFFINLLTKQNGWTPMETVVAMFKKKRIGDKNAPPALKIAGAGSGLRRKEKKFGLKQIIVVQWNENKKEREYMLNPEYRDILKNILLEGKKT
ncbi:MAG: hypothetical protein KJ886_02720 [Candidatus Thermoplasmatota archaeon]|nr:hypothetical protein [Candidatus Thermoplasmatota archaeon]